MKRFIFALAAVGVSLGLSGAAYAATTTSSMPVSVTINSACSVTATPVSFSPYPGKTVLANGSINVTCANGTPYAVTVDGGTHGTVASRNVGLSGNTVAYGLYTDATYTTQYGDGTSGTQTISGTGNGATAITTVYGKLLPGVSLPPAGLYTDTVTVTVTY